MKKFFTLAMIAIMASLPVMAQRHDYGYSSNNRYDYERSHSRWIRNYYGKDMYFGLRIGPAFSHVSGDGISYAVGEIPIYPGVSPSGSSRASIRSGTGSPRCSLRRSPAWGWVRIPCIP